MGVKSNVELTRKDAVERYVNLKAQLKKKKYQRKAAQLTDRELEDKLEEMNDKYAGGEGFENYSIVEKK